MTPSLGPGEPDLGPWRVQPIVEVARLLAPTPARRADRPWIVAVDGRSGSGKTTLAGRLQQVISGAAVVHTDDIAWWHSRFGWVDVMVEGVLAPLRAGQGVHYRPPAWEQRQRPGHVDVPAGATVVLVEGVGASRAELSNFVDAAVWVQSDRFEAERRGIARDGDDPDAVREWHAWMSEEVPFLAADRPWGRADLFVAGTPLLAHDPAAEVVVAPPLSAR